jgi:transposase
MILLASATGMSAPQIAAMVRTDESHVRKVIHAVNDEGFRSLDPDYRAGVRRRRRPSSATASSRSRAPAPTRWVSR